LITVALSTTIGARAQDVWRALTDPAERAVWDERILGEVVLSDAAHRHRTRSPPQRPRSRSQLAPRTASRGDSEPGRRVQWRFLFGGVPMVLQEEVLRSEPNARRVSRVSIGSLHFDQTLTLYSEEDETGPHTRLGMKLVAQNSIAVIGDVIPRLDVQKIVIEYVDTTLRQAQKHCER
jgi:hypothetical protein